MKHTFEMIRKMQQTEKISFYKLLSKQEMFCKLANPEFDVISRYCCCTYVVYNFKYDEE